MIGGFRFVTNGESSRHGDVSRELAVLEPPPPLGDCTPPPPAEPADAYSSVTENFHVSFVSASASNKSYRTRS